MDASTRGVGVPERQREVVGLFPGEPHGVFMTILAIQRPQPRDERGSVGFRDGGVRQKLARDHLPVIRVRPLDGSGDERVRPGAELDVGFLPFLRLLELLGICF